MADPQQTTPIPTNMQQAPQTPSQETDFFGGGEDAFQNGAVINPNAEPTPFVPEEKVWEPNITEPSKIEGEELKIEKIEPMDEPVVETMPEPVIEPIVEPVMEPIPEPVIEPVIEPEPIIEQADVRPIIESMP
ncbi:MAG: hypothetical protein NTX91_04200, partial [candidate division SR1 bacterium]|nr:hypothetical protein [candidate division SR1 bacterium]